MELKNKLMEKNLFIDILGQEKVKQQLKSTLLTDRHVIFVGPPGVGKTTLAKNLAKVLHTKNFVRIQGSPDLTAEDLLGDIDPIKALKYGPLSLEAFTKGKIFKADKGILFFDELNRCPEKLQNALLQVLSEKKATISCYDVDFDIDFVFIGTMNPEDSSTEKISDVLLDRFDLVYMSYPETLGIEKEILVTKGKQLEVEFLDELLELIIKFIRELRDDERVEKKPSVRASLGLFERAQANAVLKKRKSVCFDDIKEAVISVLSHRISLKPSVKYLQDPREFIREQFERFADKDLGDKKGGCL
jgi:MoxR-like ATPase